MLQSVALTHVIFKNNYVQFFHVKWFSLKCFIQISFIVKSHFFLYEADSILQERFAKNSASHTLPINPDKELGAFHNLYRSIELTK